MSLWIRHQTLMPVYQLSRKLAVGIGLALALVQSHAMMSIRCSSGLVAFYHSRLGRRRTRMARSTLMHRFTSLNHAFFDRSILVFKPVALLATRTIAVSSQVI